MGLPFKPEEAHINGMTSKADLDISREGRERAAGEAAAFSLHKSERKYNGLDT